MCATRSAHQRGEKAGGEANALATAFYRRIPELRRIGSDTGKLSSFLHRCLFPGFDGAAFPQGWRGGATGWFPHECARTTEAVRKETQECQASLRGPAHCYGVNRRTIAKQRERSSGIELPTGPDEAHSSTLSAEQAAFAPSLCSSGSVELPWSDSVCVEECAATQQSGLDAGRVGR